MPGYAVYGVGTAETGTAHECSIAIKPGLYPVKLTKVYYLNYGSPSYVRAVNRFNSGTMSGGSLYTPAALRTGSAAFSGTVRTGEVTVSGTAETVEYYGLTGGSVAQFGYDFYGRGSESNPTSPSAITVNPGSILQINGFVTYYVSGMVWFEELRIQSAT